MDIYWAKSSTFFTKQFISSTKENLQRFTSFAYEAFGIFPVAGKSQVRLSLPNSKKKDSLAKD